MKKLGRLPSEPVRQQLAYGAVGRDPIEGIGNDWSVSGGFS